MWDMVPIHKSGYICSQRSMHTLCSARDGPTVFSTPAVYMLSFEMNVLNVAVESCSWNRWTILTRERELLPYRFHGAWLLACSR